MIPALFAQLRRPGALTALLGVGLVALGTGLVQRYLDRASADLLEAGREAVGIALHQPYPAREDLDPLGRVDDEDLADELVDEHELIKEAEEHAKDPW